MKTDVFGMLGDILNPTNNRELLRTDAVICKITGMCDGCNEHIPINKLTHKRYLNPYGTSVLSGHFCQKCMRDSMVKSLLIK